MRKKAKGKIILTAIAIMLVTIIFISFNNKDENPRQELISRVIEIALVSGEIPDYNLIKDKKNIIISSENIDPNLLPELPDIKLTVLSPEEIKEKASKEGDFLYISFKSIIINDSDASLSINNTWAVQDNSKVIYLSGGGMTLKFHKFFGRWKEDKIR